MKQALYQRIEKALFSKGLKYALTTRMRKAGLELTLAELFKRISVMCYALTFIGVAYTAYTIFASQTFGVLNFVITLLSAAIVIFAGSFLGLLVLFLIFLNFKIYTRTKEIEKVLPDFLQLASANIRAGMSIDKALWFSIRPRFGILAKEIEIVAKKTMAGEDLEDALRDFASKYDSPTLERTVNLLVEGLDAGGEIGNLLNRIANNIQENQLTRKDMAQDVSAYAIFITFATLIAAPLLFALSYEILAVVQNLSGGLNLDESAAAALPIKFSTSGINLADFRLFVVINLIITATLSSFLIATIQKGDAMAGLKSIPINVSVAIAVFFVFSKGLHAMLSIFFI